MIMKAKIKNIYRGTALVFLAIISSVFVVEATEYEYEICPGRGEKCVVSRNGVSNPLNSKKGKDRGAVEITIKKDKE